MKSPLEQQSSTWKKVWFSGWICLLLLGACMPVQPPTPVASEEPAIEATGTIIPEEAATPEPAPTAPGAEEADTEAANDKITVGVLVVDFFGTGGAGGAAAGEDSPNCLVAFSEGEGGGHGSTGAASGLVTTNQAHGNLVYAHLKQLFGEGNFYPDQLPDTFPGMGLVERAELPEGNVILVQVDIGDNFTDRVLAQIEGARNALDLAGADYFVVNMSVVIKPCDNIFTGNDNATAYIQFVSCIEALNNLQQFFQEIGVDNEVYDPILRARAEVAAPYYVSPITGQPFGCPGEPGADLESVNSILSEVISRSEGFVAGLGNDALYTTIINQDGVSRQDDTFYVAASGNDGYPFPYAPAIYPEVVSVGSHGGFGYIPNSGEWVLGSKFTWTLPPGAEADMTGSPDSVHLEEGETITLSGTSFAAPKLTYLTTMALLRYVDVAGCYPALVYAAGQLPPYWSDWSDLGSGIFIPEELKALYQSIWANQTIGQLDCEGFLP